MNEITAPNQPLLELQQCVIEADPNMDAELKLRYDADAQEEKNRQFNERALATITSRIKDQKKAKKFHDQVLPHLSENDAHGADALSGLLTFFESARPVKQRVLLARLVNKQFPMLESILLENYKLREGAVLVGGGFMGGVQVMAMMQTMVGTRSWEPIRYLLPLKELGMAYEHDKEDLYDLVKKEPWTMTSAFSIALVILHWLITKLSDDEQVRRHAGLDVASIILTGLTLAQLEEEKNAEPVSTSTNAEQDDEMKQMSESLFGQTLAA